MENFYYKGNIVGCLSHSRGSSLLNPKVCFCCGKEVKDGESAILLINNYKSFPNMLLHEDCFEYFKNKTDELCADFENEYNKYKELSKMF